VEDVVSQLGSSKAATEASLERGLLAKFDAGCSLPLGVCSHVAGDRLRLNAVMGQRQNDRWTGLKQVEVAGTDIETLVNQAFEQLNEGTAPCA
jgi:porphobilinogen deaminase